ncbi:MAG TPA: hypothetical protein VHI13_06690 [Candidatus Kapabacteria bacterium]|nr:hypothetical protein [Candidatus Kapabacteria bacterium]
MRCRTALPAKSYRVAIRSLLCLLLCGVLHAQGEFLPADRTVPAPYAGKYEARIGGSRELNGGKLRLDIGASADLYRIPIGEPASGGALSFGADFFTWTRLRSTASFKFPVEAVDYYFGLNGSARFRTSALGDMFARLRVAHISAHLVDGDPSFTDPDQRYFTFSREFADLMAGIERRPLDGAAPGAGGYLTYRAYLGLLALTHTIPDTLGHFTPYIGADLVAAPSGSSPVALRLGYELRLNTELSTLAEHLLRVGLKLGSVRGKGVTIEGIYYSGRSPYGQHFSEENNGFSLGFAVDY